jgi:4-aminobutyrate aminotransferase-like enzyme
LGNHIEQGQLLAWVGEPTENGGWSPHLHFQIIHDLLNKQHDFPGACRPKDLAVMRSLCPDPMLLFNDAVTDSRPTTDNQALIDFRHQHLGKSLSLSYSEPLQMLRGDDVYLIDQFGQKYLDTCNNVAHVGHENLNVVKAGQLQMAVLNTNSRYLHPAINQFAANLLATLPEGLSVMHLVNSGSEANELALRMAKAYSGGEHVIALESGYHGNSMATIDISSYKFDGTGGQGAPNNTHIVPLPDGFRGLHRGTNTAQAYATYVDEQIQQLTTQGQQLSAFIAESIVSCGGQIELPDGYLKTVYQAVRQAGGVCIADEVQVGCGRVGSHFWAFESHDVVPDILTIGKPIGNGHPLAVVVCSREVADRFANGMEYFNTFGGNPVSATIGTAVLNEIKRNKLQQNAQQIGNYLKQQLTQMMTSFSSIKDVRGQGLFLGFELCDDDLKPLPAQAQYLADRMRDLGVLISTDGPDHNVIKIKPPLTFNQHHADELLLRLTTVMHENPMQITA